MNGPAPIGVYLYAGDQIIENVTTGYLYFQDSLGNTSHVTDAAGNLLERYTYSAFGQPSFFDSTSQPLTSSTHNIRHLFQGQLWTQETWLNDYRNRVELPVMGVFMQPDPIGFKGDAANLYRFCGNDPIDRSDPTGLYVERAIDFDPGLQGPGRDMAERMAENNGNNLGQRELALVTVVRARTAVRPRTKGRSFEQRAHAPAVEMLAKMTHRPEVTQSGLILDQPPYSVGPRDQKIEHKDKFDLHSPYVGREELPPLQPGQKGIIVHYHDQKGINGYPSPDVDLIRAQSVTLYFTNRDWAATGKYMIYSPGHKPQEMHSNSIIP